MRVAINQSNYLPWRGYFDMIQQVDAFVLLDDVQYTKQDWRNRNQISTTRGREWITIPVSRTTKSWRDLRIDEAVIEDRSWPERHIAKVEEAYRDAAAYEQVAPAMFELLRGLAVHERLVDVNRAALDWVLGQLGIDTPIHDSRAFPQAETPSQRLVDMLTALGADVYLSGPAARAYLDVELFAERGIEVEWMDYSGYPEYPQPHAPFEPQVSIIDLLLNTGDDARRLYRRADGA